MKLGRFSIGTGDRFGREASAQLRALEQAQDAGVEVVPVWNKSNREHNLIGTEPSDVRDAADAAVRERSWKGSYFADADHIGLASVDRFAQSCNFFTIDVADFIGGSADEASVAAFQRAMGIHQGELAIPGLSAPILADAARIESIARKYLPAIQEAARVYHHIVELKGETPFVVELSLDETHEPQTPAELFFILAAVAREGIPIQTLAPKFTGAFLKGIDYRGDLLVFEREFNEDLAVLAHAVKLFKLPENLKLSVHSGSDKFSLYPIMHRALARTGAGLHLKTAGTSWLEELIALASAGGEATRFVQEIYAQAYHRREELCAPYATVVEIDATALPSPEAVAQWPGEQLAAAIRHEPSPHFDVNLRQLLHVAFKVAAERRAEFLALLDAHRELVSASVTHNLFERHLAPLYLGRNVVL
jgi:hypothetical protein